MSTVVDLGFNIDDTAKSLEAALTKILGRDREPGKIVRGDLILDLRSCGYLGPMAGVTFCTLRRLAEAGGSTVAMKAPALERLSHYCSYSGLLWEFGLAPRPDPSHPLNVTRPVRSFTENVPATRSTPSSSSRDGTCPSRTQAKGT